MPKTSESLRDAVRLYVSRFDRITVVLPKGTKEIIRSSFGSNMGPYITSLVAKDFAEDSICGFSREAVKDYKASSFAVFPWNHAAFLNHCGLRPVSFFAMPCRAFLRRTVVRLSS